MVGFSCRVRFSKMRSPRGAGAKEFKIVKNLNAWVISIVQWFDPFPHANTSDAFKHVPDLF